jgi:hypothetical protein
VVALEEGAELARRLQGLLPAESERLRREEQAQQEMAERLRGVVNELTGRFQIGEGNQ